MVVVAEPFEALVVVVVDVIAVVIVVEESSEFSIGQNFRRFGVLVGLAVLVVLR